MVSQQQALPRSADGLLDIDRWSMDIHSECTHLQQVAMRDAARSVAEICGVDSTVLAQGLELANLLAELNLDQEAVITGLVYRSVRVGQLSVESLPDHFSSDVTKLTHAVLSLATTSLLEMSNSSLHEADHDSQVENIKRMLVAMVDDARVAVIKLAERVLALRHAKHMEPERRERVAMEARTIFAPLAGRLGIGQLKWELEDLALRYTAEETYKSIATKLQAKRGQREAQVHHIADQVLAILRSSGLQPEVSGRAKHINSIWRKMQAKQVDFDEVYDVRAVRVIVSTLAECYAVLGVVHSRWEHIPREFDDYIANPKENGYQSIHTAVLLDDGETLEVQVRTAAMHQDAELGVCAHWSYKGTSTQEDSDEQIGADRAARAFDAKMDWLRQVMEWHEELGGTEKLSTLLEHRVNDDRIFVSTPRGHVLELPAGATVLDFAYRVHTDVGHACRSARVDQAEASLDQTLFNSQRVDVQTTAAGGPQRLWLEKPLGYLRTDRARAKVVSYFRGQSVEAKQRIGHELLTLAAEGLGLVSEPTALIRQLRNTRADHTTQSDHSDSQLLEKLTTGELPFLGACESWLSQQAPFTQMDSRLQVVVYSTNRDGLLLEITQRLSAMGLALTATEGRVSNDALEAIISIETQVSGWQQRAMVLCHFSLLPGVNKIITNIL